MKSKTKFEIAQAAGISTELLRRWMMVHRREIGAMGVKTTRKVLPPRVVRYMCRELGIDDEDFFSKVLRLFCEVLRFLGFKVLLL